MKNFGTIENSTMARTDSFFAIFPFLICLALVLPEFRSNGQENSRMVQWKSHLTKFPIIENCIFERETPAVSGDRFSTRAETNFYQFRFQDNGLFVRQIENAEQASVDHTPPLGLFVGCYGKDCWSISAGNILKLFPDGGDFTAFPRDERAVIFAADRMVYSVLCYGINFLDPTTLKWLDQTNFSARSVLGEDYLGQIIRMENGLPRVLKAAQFLFCKFVEPQTEGGFWHSMLR